MFTTLISSLLLPKHQIILQVISNINHIHNMHTVINQNICVYAPFHADLCNKYYIRTIGLGLCWSKNKSADILSGKGKNLFR